MSLSLLSTDQFGSFVSDDLSWMCSVGNLTKPTYRHASCLNKYLRYFAQFLYIKIDRYSSIYK